MVKHESAAHPLGTRRIFKLISGRQANLNTPNLSNLRGFCIYKQNEHYVHCTVKIFAIFSMKTALDINHNQTSMVSKKTD